MHYIRWFDEITIDDVALVGGKNASLGQMIVQLSDKGVNIPYGFAITAAAYWHFLEANNLVNPLKRVISELTDVTDVVKLKRVGHEARKLILSSSMPTDLVREIGQAYAQLSHRYQQKNSDVAVRSSATAEDLPTASFAGQQETYLNIRGEQALRTAVKKGMASLFTDRAIVYRVQQGFDHFKVGISIGVQKMVRSDLACSGVAFTIDPETGFDQVLCINASYGLGEMVVKGEVTPDEFFVHKPTLREGYKPVLKKRLGKKDKKMVYSRWAWREVKNVSVAKSEQQRFSLTDDELLALARMCLTIEDHYSSLKGSASPQDIEWAKDGIDGALYIVQSRPETVHAGRVPGKKRTVYRLTENEQSLREKLITSGLSIGHTVVTGPARLIYSAHEIDKVRPGDILVTRMTDPDWVPIMKKVAGIITDRGGRTCHAAIVSRELSIPALVGAADATTRIRDGQIVTLDTSRGKTGYVYDGALEIHEREVSVERPDISVQVMINLADPDQAFTHASLPVDGVGLARIEFIIANTMRVHPLALLFPEKILDRRVRDEIATITAAYDSGPDFFVHVLAQEAGTIAAAVYPRPVIVRLSDFKSNEYRNLVGGPYFEPIEENPMLGVRGASRYITDWYAPAFALECAAIKRMREGMGLTNVKVMIPFVRTLDQARQVVEVLKKNGLERGDHGLELVMMVEIPSNCVSIDDFAQQFDGFSIGSNDLTQLTLGVDRDSPQLAAVFDERDQAVKTLMKLAIEGARRHQRFIGICGQAPSDYPDVTKFLIDAGITSVSFNVDALIPG